MDRLGITVSGFSGLSFAELQQLAREAESAGFEAVFSPEAMNDALANCMLMGQATSRIKVGTWIANIYLRHPLLCAQTAVAIDEVSKGRLILGLGVSHRPIIEGIYKEKMDRPRELLRGYITTVRDILSGKGLAGAPVQPRGAAYGVSIYVGTLALGTVELAGELADGVMLYLCPKGRLPKVKSALERGAAKAGRPASAVDVTTGLPTFVSDDSKAATAAARRNLAIYGQLPFYNKLFQNSGFAQEAAALAAGDPGAFSDRMLDELTLCGPPSLCRERLAAFREAGIALPILVPAPVGDQTYPQAVRKALETFA